MIYLPTILYLINLRPPLCRLISRQKLSYQLKPKESKIVKDLDCVRELHDPAYVAKDKSNTVEPGLELPAAEAEKSEEQGEGEEMKSGTILVVKQEAEPETGSSMSTTVYLFIYFCAILMSQMYLVQRLT
tara:strand:- start:76 stop:465 length:390 start_codon:yes stop_codon:yes gene_type:complete